MRLYKGITSSGFPAPIRFPVSELAVDAKELIIINNKDEILRTIFVIARGRSPRCSILTKKTNHVEREINDCSIVQMEVPRIRDNNFISGCR